MAEKVPETMIKSAAADALISAHDGTVALLWIFIARTGSTDPDAAARALCLTLAEVNAAEEKLRRMGIYPGCEGRSPSGAHPDSGGTEKVYLQPSDGLPDYSAADVVLASQQDPELKCVFDEAARITGKTLNAPNLKTLYGIHDYLGLPCDVMMLLLNYCAEISKTAGGSSRAPTMNFIEKQAYRWARFELKTLDEAEDYIRRQRDRDDIRVRILSAIGAEADECTPGLAKKINGWIEMGFDDTVVAEAYDRTVSALGKPKMAYTDSILNRWHDAGYKTLEDVCAGDPRFDQKKASVSTQKQTPAVQPKIDLDNLKDILDKI